MKAKKNCCGSIALCLAVIDVSAIERKETTRAKVARKQKMKTGTNSMEHSFHQRKSIRASLGIQNFSTIDYNNPVKSLLKLHFNSFQFSFLSRQLCIVHFSPHFPFFFFAVGALSQQSNC